MIRLALAVTFVPALLAAQSRPADLIVTNAIIYTADSAHPRAEALAVSGDRLIFVGSTAGATALAGPDTKRIDAAQVENPEAPRSGRAATEVFFGATVRYANAAGVDRVVSIVGLDEVDLDRNHISWRSPLARALMKSGPGDSVVLHAPSGTERLQILEVRYERIHVEPFTEPRGAEAVQKGRPQQ